MIKLNMSVDIEIYECWCLILDIRHVWQFRKKYDYDDDYGFWFKISYLFRNFSQKAGSLTPTSEPPIPPGPYPAPEWLGPHAAAVPPAGAPAQGTMHEFAPRSLFPAHGGEVRSDSTELFTGSFLFSSEIFLNLKAKMVWDWQELKRQKISPWVSTLTTDSIFPGHEARHEVNKRGEESARCRCRLIFLSRCRTLPHPLSVH